MPLRQDGLNTNCYIVFKFQQHNRNISCVIHRLIYEMVTAESDNTIDKILLQKVSSYHFIEVVVLECITSYVDSEFDVCVV